MTVTIPKPLVILFGLIVGGGLLAALVREAPDLTRYAKFEAM